MRARIIASVIVAAILLSHADLPARAQEDTPDPAPVEDVQPPDDASAPIPECVDNWVLDPYKATIYDRIFSNLKQILAPTVDVGGPCGPGWGGCEGYCQRYPDFQDGRLDVETTTNGWVFWRALYNATGFTDGRHQWIAVEDGYRPPLVLGPPLWFCDHPDLVVAVAFPGCR